MHIQNNNYNLQFGAIYIDKTARAIIEHRISTSNRPVVLWKELGQIVKKQATNNNDIYISKNGGNLALKASTQSPKTGKKICLQENYSNDQHPIIFIKEAIKAQNS